MNGCVPKLYHCRQVKVGIKSVHSTAGCGTVFRTLWNRRESQTYIIGLIMHERAHALGGMLLIERDTSRGTTLRLTVPLKSSEEGER
jgi:signal transduction histidine kinase